MTQTSTEPAPSGVAMPDASSSSIGRAMRRLGKFVAGNRNLAAGGVILLAVVLTVPLAGLLARVPPEQMDIMHRFEPPSAQFLLGTDNFGRSIFSRILYGSRTSLGIGLAVVTGTALLGVTIGAIAGYFRRLDNLIMRIMDGLMAFPTIMFALAIASILGPSAMNAVIALTVVYTPMTARIVRASVLVLRESEYVDSARLIGASNWWILSRHILPNSLPPLIVQLTFVFAYSVLAEATLSFLGAGPPPPSPSWGNIIAEGRNYMRDAPWIVLFPGMAILLTAISLNLMGDGLRDLIDPRLRVERAGS